MAQKWEQHYQWKLFDGDDGYAVTSPVGAFQPNNWGLYDMLGNVWEWCADWFANNFYANSPQDDPPGPSGSSKRVLRGGSWNDNPVRMRSAYRNFDAPSYRVSSIGFRVARTK